VALSLCDEAIMSQPLSQLKLFIFDLETTGISPEEDQIIEIGAVYWENSARVGGRYAMRVKPSIPIAPEATAVHGISAKDLVDCSNFSVVGPRVARHFSGEALGIEPPVACGYNAMRFDLPMINAEFARHDLPCRVDPDRLVDPFIFISWHLRHLPKRNLTKMAEQAGYALVDAHSAAADTEATGHVVNYLVKTGVMPSTLEEILLEQARIRPMLAVESAKYGYHLYEDRTSSELVIGFGKHIGTPLTQVPKSYLQFCLDNFEGLPDNVIAVFSKLI
jgi:DNA polymerase III epsilon subunit-like protein